MAVTTSISLIVKLTSSDPRETQWIPLCEHVGRKYFQPLPTRSNLWKIRRPLRRVKFLSMENVRSGLKDATTEFSCGNKNDSPHCYLKKPEECARHPEILAMDEKSLVFMISPVEM